MRPPMPADQLPIGRRILARAPSLPPDLVQVYSSLATTDLADAMASANTMAPSIQALYEHMPRLLGSAVTVNVPSGSRDVRLAAIEATRPGDVLVITATSAAGCALLGGRLAQALADKACAGVVVDGYVRDFADIISIGLPVFCRGRSPAAGPRTGPGEVNVPVACGGVVVHPGDLVVGDQDGVVVVPRGWAKSVAASASSRQP